MNNDNNVLNEVTLNLSEISNLQMLSFQNSLSLWLEYLIQEDQSRFGSLESNVIEDVMPSFIQ